VATFTHRASRDKPLRNVCVLAVVGQEDVRFCHAPSSRADCRWLLPASQLCLVQFDTGDVRFCGPITKEEKERYDAMIKRRSQAQADVSYFADKYHRARNEDIKASYFEERQGEQRMFDLINDAMPGRYKAKLENRSYAEGASRDGKTLEEFRRNRKLRDEYIG
jgi:hypothetical protein